MTIQPATLNDLEAMLEITQRAYGSAGMARKSLERNINIQPDGFFIAHSEKQPVGMVSVFDYGNFASVY